MARERILILDAETRTSLAVARSLRESNLEIALCASKKFALCSGSNSVDIIFPCPNAQNEAKEFLSFLLDLLKTYRPQLIFPNSDITLNLCYQALEEINKYTTLAIPSEESYNAISDKYNLLNLAKAFRINTPDTILIPNFLSRKQEDIDLIKNFNYPAILKPQHSVVLHENKFLKPKIFSPNSADQALLFLSPEYNKESNVASYLLQEKINGTGTALFALCKDGEAYSLFAHQRILEKPPSGGVSVLSESIPLDSLPVENCLKLLKTLSWNGACMFEFKKNFQGEFILMEINPRLWGSLQLAIDSGINFPQDIYHLFCKNNLSSKNSYKTTQRLRWELGTLDHFIINLKSSPLTTIKEVFTKNSLRFFAKDRKTENEIFKFKDPKPFLYELVNYF